MPVRESQVWGQHSLQNDKVPSGTQDTMVKQLIPNLRLLITRPLSLLLRSYRSEYWKPTLKPLDYWNRSSLTALGNAGELPRLSFQAPALLAFTPREVSADSPGSCNAAGSGWGVAIYKMLNGPTAKKCLLTPPSTAGGISLSFYGWSWRKDS